MTKYMSTYTVGIPPHKSHGVYPRPSQYGHFVPSSTNSINCNSELAGKFKSYCKTENNYKSKFC